MKPVPLEAIRYLKSLPPEQFLKQLKEFSPEEALHVIKSIGKKEVWKRIKSVQTAEYEKVKRSNLQKLEQRELEDCERQRLYRRKEHLKQDRRNSKW